MQHRTADVAGRAGIRNAPSERLAAQLDTLFPVLGFQAEDGKERPPC